MIYWFRGNLHRGIELTDDLEEIAFAQYKKYVAKEMGFHVKRYHLYIEGITYLVEQGVLKKFNPNPKAIEGERPQYIYYLKNTQLHRIKRSMPKAWLIMLFGKNIG